MVEVLHKSYIMNTNVDADLRETFQESSTETLYDSEINTEDHVLLNGENDSEEDSPKNGVKRRVQHFSESDNDTEELPNEISHAVPQNNTKTPQSSDSEDDLTIFKSVPRQSRIQKNEHDSTSESSNSGKAKKSSRLPSGSDSESTSIKRTSHKSRILKICHESSSDTDQACKNKQQQVRMRNKRDKMKDKFKNLKKSHGKGMPTNIEKEATKIISYNSEDSNDEANSIERIKLKIKEKMSSIPSICDPDTSDEENGESKSNPKQKKEKRTKLTAPKPQRMSAKQAMENMQKIRSESNRMLREKEVSLPYHRPKALLLKDIMSRRKPALSADGKSLPIKMNGDQLKHYAKMLEERQNEMKELWQSDTDDDNDHNKSDNEKSLPNNIEDNHINPDEEKPSVVTESATTDGMKSIDDEARTNDKEVTADVIPEESDKLFDDLSQSFIEETKIYKEKEKARNQDVQSTDNVTEEQDSINNMTLVFDDSKTSDTEENTADDKNADKLSTNEEESRTVLNDNTVRGSIGDQCKGHVAQESSKNNTEEDSQLISLHFDTENDDTEKLDSEDILAKIAEPEKSKTDGMDVDGFSDEDLNMDDIDNIIENADIIRDIEDKVNSQVLIRDRPLNLKPKLTGAPGMVIDLDDSNMAPKKSGVELLKERFTFFAKLKTPEEIERDKKRRIKPGNQHLRLKQELEEQMADQRTLEWEKRLESEKQQQKELKELRGEESEDENDIDKIDALLEEKEAVSEHTLSEDDEELVEDDIEMKEKPRVKNPMLENEAEESDCDEPKEGDEENENDEDGSNNSNDENDDEDNSSDSESSESEEENQPSTKKGRILKAFEDSDDENVAAKAEEKDGEKSAETSELLASQTVSQDHVLTLAQRHKSVSEDLFTSQESSLQPSQKDIKSTQAVPECSDNDVELGTQTFSILDSTSNVNADVFDESDKLDAIGESQTYNDNLQAISGIGSGPFSQDLPPLPITQVSQSQPIGEDILAMCTGKFYDNEFISQECDNNQMPLGASQEYDSDENTPMTFDKVLGNDNANKNKGLTGIAKALDTKVDDANMSIEETVVEKEYDSDENSPMALAKVLDTDNANKNKDITGIDKILPAEVDDANINTEESVAETLDKHKKNYSSNTQNKIVDDNLKSILDELDDPEFDTPRPNKFFCGATTQKAEDVLKDKEETQVRKKFIIESDDEMNEGEVSVKKKKKIKRKRLEKRALQISDDEEDVSEQEEVEDYESELEEENEGRLVEYDSEENEIEIKPQTIKQSKKKRKTTEFFEQEAELTSEDEWVGSGDEDEAGLDRMEREEGDDENFHQGRLQRELGQIHMRDVLDQDKREVRIIQELLFEDGDLGGGGRQRKFKWKNLDGDEEAGTGTDEFGDTQEEEFESEEQWRKQRHERETFLRQMQSNSEHDDSLNVSVHRTTIIKANLMSKTMSMLLEENQPVAEKDSPVVPEKKTLPSPKKTFSLLQQTYQGSILNRGKGALARLAALATPLAVDDDAPKGKSAAPSSGRNFVFAALTPEAPKVMKRKADINPGTPKLVKKMKTEEKQSISKSRLLDHMKM